MHRTLANTSLRYFAANLIRPLTYQQCIADTNNIHKGRAMLPLLQLLAIALLTPLSLHLAHRSANIKSPLWLLFFLLPLAAITLIILGHRSTALSFIPPISWAIHPYAAPLIMALAIPLMLTTLIHRLPKKQKPAPVKILLWVMFTYYVLFPLLLPLAARPSLAATPTKLDAHQTCLQTHPYTCGPASAVSCLRLLNIPADEGPLAIDAQSAPALGTDPILLALAINHLTAPHHIHCTYILIPNKNLDALPLPAIANLFTPGIGGHYVAVLAIHQNSLTIADPLSGQSQWSRSDFLTQWTGAAHIFTHQNP